MESQLQNYFFEHLLPLMFLLVIESQVLPSRTKDSKKNLPDTLRKLGSPFEIGVDGAIVFSGWSRQGTILQLLPHHFICQRRERRTLTASSPGPAKNSSWLQIRSACDL